MTDILSLMRASWAALRTEEATDERSEHDVRLTRLQRWQADAGSLEHEDVEYWAERFLRLHVRSLAGCSFERYLMRPSYYERIAAARRALATDDFDSYEPETQETDEHQRSQAA